MSRSSADAGQLAFDWSKSLDVEGGAPVDPSRQDHAASSPRVQFGHGIVADAARRAGRLNAANISDLELKALLEERQALLDKKFAGSASKTDLNRLEYVRWSLDRIEDARAGHVLDSLEDAVVRYESFLKEIAQLRDQIERATGGKK